MPVSDPVYTIEPLPGQSYRIGEFRNRDYDQIQVWVNRQPRPKFVAPDLSGVLGEVADEVGRQLAEAVAPEARVKLVQDFARRCLNLAESQLREARYEAQQWPPAVGEPAVGRLLMTAPGGKAELLYVALSRFHPEVSRDEAARIAGDMRYEDFAEVVAIVFGQGQAEPDGDADPKADTPPE